MGIPGGSKRATNNPYLCQSCTISNIIKREEYTGKKILRKCKKDSYKDKKRTPNAKKDQIVFEGAIPAIIDQETFDTAQRLRKTYRRFSKIGEPSYRLTGVLICSDCGNKLHHNRSMDWRRNMLRNDYCCSKYKERTKECSIHYIRTVVVEELILDAIKNIGHVLK